MKKKDTKNILKNPKVGITTGKYWMDKKTRMRTKSKKYEIMIGRIKDIEMLRIQCLKYTNSITLILVYCIQ